MSRYTPYLYGPSSDLANKVSWSWARLSSPKSVFYTSSFLKSSNSMTLYKLKRNEKQSWSIRNFIMIYSILVSWSSCNKVLRTGCLRATEMYCVTVLEVRSVKEGVSTAIFPLKRLGKDPFQASHIVSSSCRYSLAYRWPSSPCVNNFSFCVCLHPNFPVL